MDFSAEDYFRAARDRIQQARLLYTDDESYALTMYVGGLAVECMLRAYRMRKDPEFDSRHDLQDLFEKSGLMQINESAMRDKGLSEDEILSEVIAFKAAVNAVWALWSNNLRFASERKLRNWLVAMKKYGPKKKGDLLKANARELLNGAEQIVSKGIYLWT